MDKNLKTSVCVALKEKMGTENVLTDEEFAHFFEEGWSMAVQSIDGQSPLTVNCVRNAVLKVQQKNDEKKSTMSDADLVQHVLDKLHDELEKVEQKSDKKP